MRRSRGEPAPGKACALGGRSPSRGSGGTDRERRPPWCWVPRSEWGWLGPYTCVVVRPVSPPCETAVRQAVSDVMAEFGWVEWQRTGAWLSAPEDDRSNRSDAVVRYSAAITLEDFVDDVVDWWWDGLCRPTHVMVSSDAIAIMCSHAMGDARISRVIVDSLLARFWVAERDSRTVHVPVKRNPATVADYLSAWRDTVRKAPGRVLPAVRHLTGEVVRRTGGRLWAGWMSGRQNPESPSPVVLTHTCELAELSHFRDVHYPGSSVSMLLLVAVLRGLHQARVMGDTADVHVLVDLRRLSSRLSGAGGNCIGDLRLTAAATDRPERLADTVRSRLSSGELMIAQGIKVSLAGRRGKVNEGATRRTLRSRPVISWSDRGWAEEWADGSLIRWAGRSDIRRSFLFVPDDGVALAFNVHRADGKVHVTCAFDASRYGRARVAEALRLLLTPTALLRSANDPRDGRI